VKTRSPHPARRVEYVSVHIGAQSVVQQHAGTEKPTTAFALAVGRNYEGQGRYEMRSDSQHHGALKTRGSQPAHIAVLHVANPSMHHLEAVSGCARGEIFTFYQRGVEPTKCRFARGGSAGCTTADNEHIEQFVTQPADVAGDAMCLFHPVMIAKFVPRCAAGHTHCCIAFRVLFPGTSGKKD
jgi:hypothetical protein